MNASCEGKISYLEIKRDGVVVEALHDIGNMLLNDALTQSGHFTVDSAWTFLSTTPQSAPLPGLFSQTGLQVAVESGSFGFDSSHVGNVIQFSNGSRSIISSVTNATTVGVATTDQKNIIPSEARMYYTNTTFDDINSGPWVQRSTVGELLSTDIDKLAGQFTQEYEVVLGEAAADYPLGAVYFGNTVESEVYARVILPTPMSIKSGDVVTLRYRYTRTLSNLMTPLSNIPMPFESFPSLYSIDSITSDGSLLTISTSDPTHYANGDEIIISNSNSYGYTVGQITPNGAYWELILSEAHGFVVGDEITITQSQLSGYNGNYVVSDVIDTTTIRINNSNSIGISYSGKVSHSNSQGLYDGTFTISNTINASMFQVASDINGSDGGGGHVTNIDRCTICLGDMGDGLSWAELKNPFTALIVEDAPPSGGFVDPDGAISIPPTVVNRREVLDFGSNGQALNSNTTYTITEPSVSNGFLSMIEFKLGTTNTPSRFTQLVLGRDDNAHWGFGIDFDSVQTIPNGSDMTFALGLSIRQSL